jgi:hypothetical protein
MSKEALTQLPDVAFADALALRLGATLRNPAPEAGHLARLPIPELARAFFDARQIPAPASDAAMLRLALGQAGTRAAGFGDVLESALGKVLSTIYGALEPTWSRWAREISVSRLTGELVSIEAGQAAAVAPGGEFPPAAVTSGKAAARFRLGKAGQILDVPEELVLSDDTQAIAAIVRAFPAEAVRIEDDAAYNLLLSNPTLADGQRLFAAAHRNYATGAGTALGADSLATAMAAMRAMTGAGPADGGAGKVLSLRPAVLLVPAALEPTARALVRTLWHPGEPDALDVITEGRLDADSATAWYLIANRAQIDTLIMAFLAGMARPEIIRIPSRFASDGSRWRLKAVCQAAVGEFRGILKRRGT